MNGDGAAWGVILAGGSGTRLSPLTTDPTGTVIPKQFCSFSGGRSLLRTTVERLEQVLDRDRIVVAVSAQHRRWWEPELADLPPDNIVVQPCNRGTACGVLLPLVTILHRDPGARIVVSPSDHYVREEETLAWSLAEALAHVDARPRLLVLLGMEPDRPETEYGWITPAPPGEDAVQEVTSFVEKPDPDLAHQLMASGALWSSFTFVATAETLMDQFRRSLPWLVDRFSLAFAYESWDRRQDVLLSLYDRLPTVDFSRRVLQQAYDRVRVLAVPPCGWTDLGTPERVAECVRCNGFTGPNSDCPFPQPAATHGARDSARAGKHLHHAPLDLAEVASRAFEVKPLERG